MRASISPISLSRWLAACSSADIDTKPPGGIPAGATHGTQLGHRTMGLTGLNEVVVAAHLDAAPHVQFVVQARQKDDGCPVSRLLALAHLLRHPSSRPGRQLDIQQHPQVDAFWTDAARRACVWPRALKMSTHPPAAVRPPAPRSEPWSSTTSTEKHCPRAGARRVALGVGGVVAGAGRARYVFHGAFAGGDWRAAARPPPGQVRPSGARGAARGWAGSRRIRMHGAVYHQHREIEATVRDPPMPQPPSVACVFPVPHEVVVRTWLRRRRRCHGGHLAWEACSRSSASFSSLKPLPNSRPVMYSQSARSPQGGCRWHVPAGDSVGCSMMKVGCQLVFHRFFKVQHLQAGQFVRGQAVFSAQAQLFQRADEPGGIVHMGAGFGVGRWLRGWSGGQTAGQVHRAALVHHLQRARGLHGATFANQRPVKSIRSR